MSKRKRQIENSKNKKVKYTYLKTVDSIDPKLVVIEPYKKQIKTINFSLNLQKEDYDKIFGEKKVEKISQGHIDNKTKFIVQNNMHFGCELILDEKKKIRRMVSFEQTSFTFFKTIKILDIPMYIIFRKYVIEKLNDEIKIRTDGKVFVCTIGDKKCSINIEEYQDYKFLPKNDFAMCTVKSVKELQSLMTFKSTFYFCYDLSENVFKKLTVFPLSKLCVQRNLKTDYDTIFALYKSNINMKCNFVGFVELERFIFEFIPIYFYLSILTSYPFELFFSGYGNGIVQSIDYLKLRRCFKHKYQVRRPTKNKEEVTLEGMQEVFELNKYFIENGVDNFFVNGSTTNFEILNTTYEGYLNHDDIIRKDGYLINKIIFEIDIYRCYGSSFLNIYEKDKLEEFKVLYDIVKKLFYFTRKSKSDVVKTVCKMLVNAGCYGSLNRKNPKLFSLFPNLMLAIVKNAQDVMQRAYDFLEANGLQVVFSKNDSYFLIFKSEIKLEDGKMKFDKILEELNLYLSKIFKNSKFKLKGIYSNGIWFHQNSYVVKEYDRENFILKGQLKSKVWPKTIRMFAFEIIKRMFNGETDFNFDDEFRNHQNNTNVTFDNFIFKELDKFYVYVRNYGETIKLNFKAAISNNLPIDANYTYSKYENFVKTMLSKLCNFR
jgi:hypothetical protein